MKRHDFDDLAAFLIVAEERSFTRAASRLGISPSGLSHMMRLLEERLGVRLLARTTRSVATTEAGKRLLSTLRPAFADINRGLQELGDMREKPSGTVRITAVKHAAEFLVIPMLDDFQREFPDIKVELLVGDRLEDIVASRFDAGIRLLERVEKDMIAIRVGPNLRAAVVGAPSYFKRRPAPTSLADLAGHDCINYYMASSGAPYAWEFDDKGRDVEFRVSGTLMVNDTDMMIRAAVAGLGLAYVFEDYAKQELRAGRLIKVLDAHLKPFAGYSVYYPSRRQVPPALSAFIEALRKFSRQAETLPVSL